jgi:hypothetical protein
VASIALAVGLAYVFGFTLTAVPLVRAGLAVGAVASTALAADTVSITIMEVIDNLTVVLVPGALDAGLADPLIYASIAAGFAVAYPFAFLANRYMIARGKDAPSRASTTEGDARIVVEAEGPMTTRAWPYIRSTGCLA